MKHTYYPRGVCSQKIEFTLKDGRLYDLKFTDGCNGNLSAIAKLTEGMEAQHVADLLKGNTCGFRATSCADQLALAILEAEAEERAAG